METHRHRWKLDSVWRRHPGADASVDIKEGMREKDFPSFKKLMSLETGIEWGFTTSRQKGHVEEVGLERADGQGRDNAERNAEGIINKME